MWSIVLSSGPSQLPGRSIQRATFHLPHWLHSGLLGKVCSLHILRQLLHCCIISLLKVVQVTRYKYGVCGMIRGLTRKSIAVWDGRGKAVVSGMTMMVTTGWVLSTTRMHISILLHRKDEWMLFRFASLHNAHTIQPRQRRGHFYAVVYG